MSLTFGPQVIMSYGDTSQGSEPRDIPGINAQPPESMTLKQPCKGTEVLLI